MALDVTAGRGVGVGPERERFDADRPERARRHGVRFFHDDRYPADWIAEYLHGGIEGGAALVFVRTSRAEAITAALSRRGLNVDWARDDGRLVVSDATELARSIVVDGMAHRTVFDDRVGNVLIGALARHGRARAYGEIVDELVQAKDPASALLLENWWNELLAGRPAELQCGYDLKGFTTADSAQVFRHVCSEHDMVEPAERPDVDLGRALAELQQTTFALHEEARRAHDAHARADQERERAELHLVRAEAASRAKDEFLAMLGHELRNPLAPILTAVQLMRLRASDVLVKERTIIERQVSHMVRLIDDLLDVSRISSGTVRLERERVELAEVLADAVEIAGPILEERAHQLVTAVAPLGLRVDVDASRMTQVIVNLLTNAARYSPPKSVIMVKALQEGTTVSLSVRDSGVGIEPELLPRIFEMFTQGRQSSDRPQGGLGLGLAIARNLVEMHGGTLRAESQGTGKGSIFTIELPLAEPLKEPVAPATEPAVRTPGGPRAILVVDDNVDAANTLGLYLEAMGHHVRVAHDGPEAIRIAHELRPELALLDLGLPRMDGFELARLFEERLGDQRPRLVAVTGYGQHADRERSRTAGFHDHLVKPVDLDLLLAIIEQLPAVT